MNQIAHFIANTAVGGNPGRTAPVFNPATGTAEKQVPLATDAEVREAVAA